MGADELGELLSSLGQTDLTEKQLSDMIAEVDTDGGGEIGFDEFIQMMSGCPDQKEVPVLCCLGAFPSASHVSVSVSVSVFASISVSVAVSVAVSHHLPLSTSLTYLPPALAFLRTTRQRSLTPKMSSPKQPLRTTLRR